MSMEFTLNDLQRRRVEEHLALVEQVLRRSIKTNETVDGMGHDDLYQDGCIALCRAAVSYDCIASRCRQIRTQKEYSAKALREMCNSYGWGFCRGLSAAFQKQEAEHQEWGLVMVVPQAVEDAVSKMKRSSYKISSTSSMNRQYAAMGYADGQEFDMRRRLEPSA